MTKHIAHLLAAYTEGQLGKRRTRRVQQHVAACPACYEELARHERLAADLRLTLGQSTHAFRHQPAANWHVSSAKQGPAKSYLSPTTLLPIILSLALLVIPILSTDPGPTTSEIAPRQNDTLLSTEAVAMQAPIAEEGQSRSELMTTTSEDSPMIESTPPPPDASVLAEPVPQPPSPSERAR
jgi:anti-sigma factor RsiW